MDFTLSNEQLLIRDSVARFAADHRGGDAWPTFVELGWTAIGAPEDAGGVGGPVETLLLCEQLGRQAIVSPYVGQVVFPGAVLAAAGRSDLLERLAAGEERFAVAYEEPGARCDPAPVRTTAVRDGDAYTISGRKHRVLDASTADTALVSARTGDEITVFAVPLADAGVSRTAFAAEDGSDVADVHFAGVRVAAAQIVGGAGAGLAPLERGLDAANAALCAEALGLCSTMLELTVGYTKQRVQFGVPIGSFQALQHRMAEMFMELELIRSMAYRAAMILDEADAAVRKRGISASKVQVARSGRFVGQNAIQLHGGIGMTEEYKLGQFFKRMTLLERLLGDVDYHLARFRTVAAAPAAPREREPARA